MHFVHKHKHFYLLYEGKHYRQNQF